MLFISEFAHYDSANGFPGADDNASGVAGILEICRILKDKKLVDRNIDIVFYSTEEPPYYATNGMGSFVHAESIKDEKDVKLVMVYDLIGYFSEAENSQGFPLSIMKYMYPTTGNYIALVSNFENISATREMKKGFTSRLRKKKLIGVESINMFEIIPGIDFSDHRSYWKFGIPAVMITDTSFYRNANYHTAYDTSDTLNYKKIKEVVDATIYTVLNL